MKIKICGITNIEDATTAKNIGAWALGFIFVKESPRFINTEKAAIISKNINNIERIGVFANTTESEILQSAKMAGLTKIQLHGDEPPEFCSKIKELSGLEIIKALRVKNFDSISEINNYKNSIDYVLLDSFSKAELGGTGMTFDWNVAKSAKTYGVPIILAGGINTENILNAYETVIPFAIDLSSGVEAEKGKKDHEKLKKLQLIINKQ